MFAEKAPFLIARNGAFYFTVLLDILVSVLENGAGACRCDQARIPCEVAGFYRRRARLEGLLPLLQFIRADFQGDRFIRDINGNRIPFLDEGDRTPFGRFRRDVSDGGAAGTPAEPAVGQERDAGIKPHPRDGGRRSEHLPHAGSALRPFVT